MNRWVAEQQQMVAVVKSVAAAGGNGGDVYPYQVLYRKKPLLATCQTQCG
jgi:hypothetical protein